MTTEIVVDFNKIIRPIKPMHGINNAPLAGCSEALFHYLSEAGIPYSRLHDTGGRYGGFCFVDIANVFRDFEADVSDPDSYDFAFTDWLLAALNRQGVKPFYRLGATIENDHRTKAYHIFPPRDNLKWAQICAGIIRHYNEGWANGFRYGIEYWELWNEPDNEPEIADNPMWKGTKEQFFALYETASNYLKKEFPHLKIGGYASCGFYAIAAGGAVKTANSSARTEYFVEFLHDFLKYISSPEHKSPLDFFSWHSYSGIQENIQYAEYARKTLDAYGFHEAESILNEWNPGIAFRGELQDAANIAAMMCAMQKTSLAQMAYYDGQVDTPYGGMFNPLKPGVFKAYYAFVAFNELYKLRNEAESRGEGEGVYAAAASNGGSGAVLLVNTTETEKKVSLVLGGIESGAILRCRLLDQVYDFEEIKDERYSGKRGEVVIPAGGLMLVKVDLRCE